MREIGSRAPSTVGQVGDIRQGNDPAARAELQLFTPPIVLQPSRESNFETTT